MRGRAERGVRGNARADGASPFSPQVRTREDDTIFPRTAKVASNRASGVSAEARGGRARFDRRACWVLSDGSEIFPRRPNVSTSSARLEGSVLTNAFLTVSSHAIPHDSRARVRVRRGSGERGARRAALDSNVKLSRLLALVGTEVKEIGTEGRETRAGGD